MSPCLGVVSCFGLSLSPSPGQQLSWGDGRWHWALGCKEDAGDTCGHPQQDRTQEGSGVGASHSSVNREEAAMLDSAEHRQEQGAEGTGDVAHH